MRNATGWKLCVLLLVVAVHAWLGWTLANYRPHGGGDDFRRLAPRPDDLLMVLSFETREAPATVADPVAPPRKRRRAHASTNAPAGSDPQAGSATGTRPGQGDARALDLRLAAPLDKLSPRADPFSRPPGLAHESTRFDSGWQSDGNLTQVVARRSKIAGAVLGALGALRKPCTDRQRRDYDPACVPNQYRYSEDD